LISAPVVRRPSEGTYVVDVVRVKLREQARRRPVPEGSSYYNLKRNSRYRLAADGAGCHMTDN